MNQQTIKIIGLICGSTALVYGLWILFKRKKSEEDEDDDDEMAFGDLNAREKCATASQSVIEMEVPAHAVGYIIGKSGVRIKKLKNQFGVRFDFEKEDFQDNNAASFENKEKKHRALVIKGDREKVHAAEEEIKLLIAEAPKLITGEMFIPSDAIGFIIGKGGKSIKELRKASGAKIDMDDAIDPNNSNKRKVILIGTNVQVDYAKLLIEERIEVLKAGGGNKKKIVNEERKNVSIKEFPMVKLPEKGIDFRIFVSAVDSPGSFSIQLITEESTQLDYLNEELNQYYENRESNHERLDTGSVNDICVARYPVDNEFYRASIEKFNDNRTVDISFFDFGDLATVPVDDIKTIREDFLKLPRQAIECALSIKPADTKWSKEAIDEFEKLTYTAQWIPLIASVIDYESDKPILNLLDLNDEKNINIADELVSNGFAVK